MQLFFKSRLLIVKFYYWRTFRKFDKPLLEILLSDRSIMSRDNLPLLVLEGSSSKCLKLLFLTSLLANLSVLSFCYTAVSK
jgi:hypothetical protein